MNETAVQEPSLWRLLYIEVDAAPMSESVGESRTPYNMGSGYIDPAYIDPAYVYQEKGVLQNLPPEQHNAILTGYSRQDVLLKLRVIHPNGDRIARTARLQSGRLTRTGVLEWVDEGRIDLLTDVYTSAYNYETSSAHPLRYDDI